MAKKTLSLVLVIITIFSTLIITSSAATYSTGNYAVSATNGVYVRNGAGTSNAVVGAASKGIAFYVSKVSNNWGYTSSIKCTNGTKSGWVCLDYCIYKNSGDSSATKYYTLTYNANGGSGAPASQTVKANTGFYLSSSKPTRSGYTFLGWSTKKNATSASYAPGKGVKLSSNVTLYAVWKKNVDDSEAKYYTLTYNANGGAGAPASQTVKANTGFYLSSSEPIRPGYTFLGWSTKKNATSASYAPGKGVKLSSNVTLYAVWKKKPTVNPTSVSLNSTSCTLNVGKTKQLTATVYPSNSTDKKVYWSSSDSAVVYVSSSGKITAEAPGVATITAKTSNGKTKSCKVTVKGVKISGEWFYTLPVVGDIYYLSAKAYPSDTTEFTWYTSNSKIVSISSNGKMTAKSAGTATITVKTSDGRVGSQTITVSAANKWKTGNFEAGHTAKNYTTVTLNKNTGDAQIKIYTYSKSGSKTSGKIHVTLRDTNGNWICEFDTKSGATLNLGDDYGTYRVYIAEQELSDFIELGKNSIKCYSWAIECTKNCYI